MRRGGVGGGVILQGFRFAEEPPSEGSVGKLMGACLTTAEQLAPRSKFALRKSSSRSSDKSTKLGRVLVDSAKQIARHMRGEIELPMKVVRVVPEVDVRAIREGQGLTREEFAERYGLQARAIQEWEQGRRKPEPAVRAYMLVIKNQPAAVRKALTAA